MQLQLTIPDESERRRKGGRELGGGRTRMRRSEGEERRKAKSIKGAIKKVVIGRK